MKYIREWEMKDVSDLAEALNNKKIQDNLRDGLPYPYTESDAKMFIKAMIDAPKDSQYTWAIIYEQKSVGSIGIFRQVNIHNRTAEMGYYIAEPYWGKGIVTNAVKEACDFVFKNTDIIRIFADPFSENTGSRRVLEKAGFTHEGTLHRNAVKNGKILDMEMYGLWKDR